MPTCVFGDVFKYTLKSVNPFKPPLSSGDRDLQSVVF